MKNNHVFIKTFCLYFLTINCCVYGNKKLKSKLNGSAIEKPLILTPLINEGKIEEARAAAEVKLEDFKNIKSYAGFFTVNERYNSNLFFWFFPSQADYSKAPVLLWLEGGPGASSLLDLFNGTGPFEITSDFRINSGKYAWIQNHSVIYVDNPAGVGYSFTDEDGYAQNQTIVGEQLYEALLQFFQLFPELQKNNFFAAGLSYAGKYVPAISYRIHKNNLSAKQKINLKGLVIVSGMSDPEHQSIYSEYLYQVGVIDFNERHQMKKMENKYVKYIRNKQWQKAFGQYNEILIGNNSLYKNATGLHDYKNYIGNYNMTYLNEFVQFIEKYLQREDVRASLHVGSTPYDVFSQHVLSNLALDMVKSVAPWISELLAHYKVLLVNGQLDVICAYPLTINFLRNLNFRGADEYRTAVRHKLYVGSDLAGYIKQGGNLTEVLVRNAGHGVHFDQPYWSFHLIRKFTHNILLH